MGGGRRWEDFSRGFTKIQLFIIMVVFDTNTRPGERKRRKREKGYKFVHEPVMFTYLFKHPSHLSCSSSELDQRDSNVHQSLHVLYQSKQINNPSPDFPR